MNAPRAGGDTWSARLGDGGRERLAARLLEYVRGRRWFRAKARVPRGARLVDLVPLDADALPAANEVLGLLEVSYAEGEADHYVVPLSRRNADITPDRDQARPTEDLRDGLVTGTAAAALFDLASTAGSRRGEAGQLRGNASPLFAEVMRDERPLPRVPRLEQTNSTVMFGDRALLKVYRRLESGPSPEVEMGEYLTRNCRPPCAPRVLGTVTYHPDDGPPRALGIVHELVANDGDAWSLALRELDQFFNRVSSPAPNLPRLAGGPSLLAALARDPWPAAEATIGPFYRHAGVLGRRIGELHLALARGADAEEAGADFLPEPLTASDRAAIAARAGGMLDRALETLRAKLETDAASLGGEASLLARASLAPGAREALRRRLAEFRDEPLDAQKTRTHGDLHLGQILALAGGDFTIIDFEGEPARPLAERRAKASPLRDVMGMVRSFDYAPAAALRERHAASGPPSTRTELPHWGRLWTREITLAFLRAYFATVGSAAFIPRDREQLARLLTIFELEKVIYEVGYELDNRPDWVGIPLAGLSAIAASGEAT